MCLESFKTLHRGLHRDHRLLRHRLPRVHPPSDRGGGWCRSGVSSRRRFSSEVETLAMPRAITRPSDGPSFDRAKCTRVPVKSFGDGPPNVHSFLHACTRSHATPGEASRRVAKAASVMSQRCRSKWVIPVRPVPAPRPRDQAVTIFVAISPQTAGTKAKS